MSANSVKNHLVKVHSLMDRVTFTLEVSHVNVLCVEKSIVIALDSEDIRQFTLERNHSNVNTVRKSSIKDSP